VKQFETAVENHTLLIVGYGPVCI